MEWRLASHVVEKNIDTLVCFSHLRWNFVYQRPQHLMSRAAKDRQVIFFEEPLESASAISYLRCEKDRDSGVLVATPMLRPGLTPKEVVSEQRALLDLMLAGLDRHRLCLWYYTPMALAFSSHFGAGVCVYDNMDELSAFKNPPEGLLEQERQLFEKASVVFTGGHSLFAAKRHRHENIHPFPSSIDAAHFEVARSWTADPADQAHLPRPRAGFFGVIDERLDVALLARLAELLPHWQFVMVGPIAKVDQAILPRRENISWLGMRSYAELPRYLAGWDIGIMPFAQNEATRFISPTKTPEFLAAGLPVVATPIPDVVNPYGQHGLVEIAADAGGFTDACESLIARPREEWLKAVDAHLSHLSWDKTWAGMDQLIRRRTKPGAIWAKGEVASSCMTG